MNEEYTNVEVDLPTDELMWLAMEAHRQGITLNDLVVDILEEYIQKDNINAIYEETSTEDLEFSLKGATKDILRKGVTEETLSNFGYTFTQWFEESCGDLKCTELFKQAFDEIDEEDSQNG